MIWRAIMAVTQAGLLATAAWLAMPVASTSPARAGQVVMDAGTGAVLAGAAETAPRFPASITKLMTIFVALEAVTAGAINNMAFVIQKLGRLEEAEPLYEEALAWRRRELGDDHPGTLASITNMGFILHEQGRFNDAEPYVRESLERKRRTLGGVVLRIGAIAAIGVALFLPGYVQAQQIEGEIGKRQSL